MHMPPSMLASPLQRIKFEVVIEKYSFCSFSNEPISFELMEV